MRPAGSSALPMSPLLEEEGEGSARAPSERVRRGRLVAAVGAAAVVAGLLVAGAQHRQAAPHRLMASGCADVIQTARDTGDRLSRLGCVHFEDDFDAPNVIDLTGARTGHAILGFGGAFTEASALVWQALPADKREEFVRMYFDPDAGIGYTLGRVHINSCDFSLYSYSFDDVTDDWDLAFFDDDVSHDQRTMIPLILEAQRAARRPLHMLASPWSPPAWMKTSGHMDSSDKPGLRAECHDVWARYISRWISAYERLGVPIWGVTFQNEPENPAAWEACVYDAEQMVHWVGEHLGPVLRAQQPGVKIFSFDHNKVRGRDEGAWRGARGVGERAVRGTAHALAAAGRTRARRPCARRPPTRAAAAAAPAHPFSAAAAPQDHLLHWANRSFTDPKASAYFDGVAFHWYSGSEFHHVKKVHDAWPDKMLLPSEATYERYLCAHRAARRRGGCLDGWTRRGHRARR